MVLILECDKIGFIGFEGLVTPGLISCPTTKCEDLGNQPHKSSEKLTSIFVNLDVLSHHGFSEHLYCFFFTLLVQNE
jgi:hypothetical protein